MTDTILLVGLLPFGLAFVLNLPHMMRQLNNTSAPLIWLGIAWSAMFIGQAQIFGHKQEAVNVSSLGSGALYQLSWMGVAALILTFLIIQAKLERAAWKLPLVALLIYAVLGIASSGVSLAPQLAAYKATQVAMDATLAIIALSYLIRYRNPRALVELSYFWLLILIVSAALGGLIMPELAFKEIGGTTAGGGTFGAFLQGVVPIVAANELGLLAGIIVVVSVRRAFEPGRITIRFFWMTAAILGISVAFLAQSRTSLASTAVALIIMLWMIQRMRKIAILSTLGLCVILAAAVIQNTGVIFSDDITKYVRRGSTDEQLKNLSGRTILFERGLAMSADRPFLGYGFETGARLSGEPYGIARGSNMHNAHIQVIVDSGYIGYLIWLMFLLPCVFTVWFVFRKYHRKLAIEIDRYNLECSLVMFVLFFRSFLGHVMVSHQQNIMIFLAIYVSIIAGRRLAQLSSQTVPVKSEDEHVKPRYRNVLYYKDKH